MPSWYRDPEAPLPNRARELRDLPLTRAHRPIRDAYLAFDGAPIVA